MIATNQEGCDPERLLQLLNNRASVDDESIFASHIEGCVSCQAKLEELAAKRDQWEAVRQSFSEATVASQQELDFFQTDALPLKPGESSATHYKFLQPSTDKTKMGLLGHIEIVSVIGQGGMGIVFKGYDPTLKRFVAVKVLSPEHAVKGTARARFRREAESIAAVVDDHVVPIHSVQAEHNPPYLVMAFVPGYSLQEKLDTKGFFGVAEILRIGQQIASGLESAHVKGLVHRDIKPANVLLEDGLDRVKLTDFGLARSVDDVMLTRLGGISGTPQFMSPEQASGEKVDFRSDLFSLGITLYAMGTGCLPFNGDSSLAVMGQIREHVPCSMRELNREIPIWLDNLVFRLLEKSPDKRYQSASTVADLLEKCLAHVQQPTLVDLPVGLDLQVKRKPIFPLSTFSWFQVWIGFAVANLIITLLIGLWTFGFLNQASPIKQDPPAQFGHNTFGNAGNFKSRSPESERKDRVKVYWLPGQVQPGKHQIFSFGQGVIKGHIFTRSMKDGCVFVTIAGISSDDRIQINRVAVRLINEQGQEIPLKDRVANSTKKTFTKDSSYHSIGFSQRTEEPLLSPAVIQLVVETPAELETE